MIEAWLDGAYRLDDLVRAVRRDARRRNGAALRETLRIFCEEAPG